MRTVQFHGVDGFNRPVFRAENGDYYGSTSKLVDLDCSEEQVKAVVTDKDLCYFGRSFDCEPCGGGHNEVTIKWRV